MTHETEAPEAEPSVRIVDADWAPCSMCRGHGRLDVRFDEDPTCEACGGSGLAECPCGEHDDRAGCSEWIRRRFLEHADLVDEISRAHACGERDDDRLKRFDEVGREIATLLVGRMHTCRDPS